MKILHIIDSGGLYGAEVMLLNLVSEQIKNGQQTTIASIGEHYIGDKPIEIEAQHRNIPIKKFRMKAGLNLFGAKVISDYANMNGFQLFHSHGYKGNILLGVLPRKIRKLPIVSTVHGYTSTRFFSKMYVYEFLDSIVLNHLDAVVLVNEQIRHHLKIKKINNRRITVIDNGIPTKCMLNDTAQFESAESDRKTELLISDFCENSFVIGSIGRYSKEKGYDLLIEALKQLRVRGLEARLLLIGEGEERKKLEHLIRDFGLERYVLLTGYLANACKFMGQMDVYVISSHTEGLPITLLEAMRAKLPVVATSVGGIPEVLENGKCGILIPPKDVGLLVDALAKAILDTSSLQELAQRAQKRLLSHYSSNRMAKDYQTLYESILSRNMIGRNGLIPLTT